MKEREFETAHHQLYNYQNDVNFFFFYFIVHDDDDNSNIDEKN